MRGSGIPLADPISAAWNTVARFDDYESGLWAGLLFGIRYDLIAREGTVERARYLLGEAGLMPEPGPAPDTQR